MSDIIEFFNQMGFMNLTWQQGLMIRSTGDILALSPPLIIERSHIDQIVETLRGAIRRAA